MPSLISDLVDATMEELTQPGLTGEKERAILRTNLVAAYFRGASAVLSGTVTQVTSLFIQIMTQEMKGHKE